MSKVVWNTSLVSHPTLEVSLLSLEVSSIYWMDIGCTKLWENYREKWLEKRALNRTMSLGSSKKKSKQNPDQRMATWTYTVGSRLELGLWLGCLFYKDNSHKWWAYLPSTLSCMPRCMISTDNVDANSVPVSLRTMIKAVVVVKCSYCKYWTDFCGCSAFENFRVSISGGVWVFIQAHIRG